MVVCYDALSPNRSSRLMFMLLWISQLDIFNSLDVTEVGPPPDYLPRYLWNQSHLTFIIALTHFLNGSKLFPLAREAVPISSKVSPDAPPDMSEALSRYAYSAVNRAVNPGRVNPPRVKLRSTRIIRFCTPVGRWRGCV